MVGKSGGVYNAWVRWSDERNGLDFYKRDPDTLHQAHQQQPTSQEQQQSQPDDSIISGGTDLFDLPADGGDDPKEAQFRNRMQQQQKKKRGRRM